MLEQIKAEAAKHGALVREFTDLGLESFIQQAQLDWSNYLNTLDGAHLILAQSVYWKAYSSDPLKFKQTV